MSFALDHRVKAQLHGLQMNDRTSSLTLGAQSPITVPKPANQPAATPKKTLG